jgi:CTD small phosphatase-like protein 2
MRRHVDAACVFTYVEADGEMCKVTFNRLHVKEFLQDLAKRYEIIVYTASDPNYADFVIDYLERKVGKVFSYRLYEEHCITIKNMIMFKCLNLFSKGRNSKDIAILQLMVDNFVQNFALFLTNGVPIKTYKGEKDDELIYLAKYLRELAQEDDIRKKIEGDFETFLVQ